MPPDPRGAHLHRVVYVLALVGAAGADAAAQAAVGVRPWAGAAIGVRRERGNIFGELRGGRVHATTPATGPGEPSTPFRPWLLLAGVGLRL